MPPRRRRVSPRWKKAVADLWDNKVRTLLVALSIGVGVFAVGTIVAALTIIQTDMNADYQSVTPHGAVIYASPFDDDLVATARHVPGVAFAEGRSGLAARVLDPDGALQPVSILAIPADGQMTIDRIRRADGGADLRLGRHEAFLETSYLSPLGLQIGDSLTLNLTDGRERAVRIAGLVQDVTVNSQRVGGPVPLYVTPDTMEWLGGSRLYNRLLLVVAERQSDSKHVKQVADAVADKLSGAGLAVSQVSVSRPGEHPAKSIVDSLLAVMALLGVLTVGLSAFLVVNTISALLGQQVRQIGVLKAIGASSWQVLALYLALVVGFGCLAFAGALPLSGLAAWGFASFVAGFVNFNLGAFRIPPIAIALELLIAIVMPLLAALFPVIAGTRITVREAIASYGLGQGSWGHGLVDRALERVRRLPRPWLLSLRNAFRRKGRLALTLSALTLGGAIFLAVLDVQAAFTSTIEETYGYSLFDVNVNLVRPRRVDQVQAALREVPGVSHVEAWTIMNAQALNPDPTLPAVDVQLQAPPADSTLIEPIMVSGRWLVPEDDNAVVIGNHMLARRPDLRVGDSLTIVLSEKETTWQVVGIYSMKGDATSPILYMNGDALASRVGLVGESTTYRIATADKTAAAQREVADQVDRSLGAAGIGVSNAMTGSELRAQTTSIVNILITFLLLMAVLIAVVGGLGLMGTMSMNVLERTREIGVLRAIGASNQSILGMVLLEGVLIGGLSWLLGSALSLPIGAGLSAVAGSAFVKVPMPLVVSPIGFLVWLLIALVLSAVASLLPAWRAVRLTIREILAYE